MDEPLRNLDWWYPEHEDGDPDGTAILAEINGWRTAPELDTTPGVVHNVRDEKGVFHHGRQVDDYLELKDDGGTACGCWIYTGCYGSDEINKVHRREPHGPYGHGWGFAWPSDRRIIYNRASAKPNGEPWSERKKLVWWDKDKGEWTGLDVPDFVKKKAPDFVPAPGAKGLEAIRGDAPVHAPQRWPRMALRRQGPWKTARCRRTTSRWNPRCTTRCTPGKPIPASIGSAARTTVSPGG